MSPEHNASGLGDEAIIIGLTQALKDCGDIHHPSARMIAFLNMIEKHGEEAYRRAVMRKAAFGAPIHEAAQSHALTA